MFLLVDKVIGKDVLATFSFLTGDCIFARIKISLFCSNKNHKNFKYSNKLSIFKLNQCIFVIILIICANTWIIMVPDLYYCLFLNYAKVWESFRSLMNSLQDLAALALRKCQIMVSWMLWAELKEALLLLYLPSSLC